ncbi:biotin/lipoyl-containing protein [Rhodoligotrophos defluvii]|uniref:biotin/lipoyl-containing protein n=1 Tax=Rhodoligotrophos defluvii TaxID=2561934 RepID=UPI0010C94647|nr:acetyl-CoA carboxylase biotin carboxyl carrier protein subunit [Rhodoligotrophos defluvii]
MKHLFVLDGQEYELWLGRDACGYRLLLDQERIPVALASDGCGRDRLTVGRVSVPALAAVDGDVVHVHVDGVTRSLRWVDPIARYAAHSGASLDDIIVAPMPGTVISVLVEPGHEVARGETLVVIESMKLETAIKAPRDATIDLVHVSPGRTFDRSAPLVTLAPASEG